MTDVTEIHKMMSFFFTDETKTGKIGKVWYLSKRRKYKKHFVQKNSALIFSSMNYANTPNCTIPQN